MQFDLVLHLIAIIHAAKYKFDNARYCIASLGGWLSVILDVIKYSKNCLTW